MTLLGETQVLHIYVFIFTYVILLLFPFKFHVNVLNSEVFEVRHLNPYSGTNEWIIFLSTRAIAAAVDCS